MTNADNIIAEPGLSPHPEGGHYQETFRDQIDEARAFSTAIYYLLKQDKKSHWHRRAGHLS